ncbi:MAG: glutamate--tRNA ligase [Chloroflexi bacterium]|nr:glutamate--tRNA ligase [Chloroflexota bacterium]
MAQNVRVRYAPSPTGVPHVGNIRTALFNWLFARHHGGAFILRIEDTDVARTVPGAVEAIMGGLEWLGLDWDEGPKVGGYYGPYFQSQRLGIYGQEAQRLVAEGWAYRCFCSPERLAEMRKEQMSRHQPPGYDRRCRSLSEREVFPGVAPVVRFKTPLEGETRFLDLIRGEVVVENRTLDDFILLKSDGYPTYHLASVVDDHLMAISHVMRADEWLASTPRHMLLYQALGYPPPHFAHLPMILGPDRSKLSKRHGATSIMEFREQGYLPQAMVNFLALLGWSLDDKTEIMSRQELIRHFSLERIGKTGAIFSHEKLGWMNGVYLRQLSLEDLLAQVLPYLERDLSPPVPRPLDRGYVAQALALVQERMRILREAAELTDFFFLADVEYPAALLYQGLAKGALEGSDAAARAMTALEAVVPRLKHLNSWDAASLEGLLRPLAYELRLTTGQLFGLLRVAVTGRTAAPPLFQTMAVLGRERCLRRLTAALGKLASLQASP